jgi:hypothetical protein
MRPRVPHDFNRRILEQTAHRPWPLPDRPWIMRQTWHDLLFAHWPIDPALLHSRIPRAFTLDLFEGQAWLGIVPFRMTNVAPRFVPAVRRLSEFAELNVRTYVRAGDRGGVYFFSLDAASALAVRAARLLFNLPYFSATMFVEPVTDAPEGHAAAAIHYESRRRGQPQPAEFVATYAPVGPSEEPRPGTLESFLTERYCLYALTRGGNPYRLEIHHPPWPLAPATATMTRNTLSEACGIPLPGVRPLLHFARRQDMVGWAPERL